MKNNGKSGLPAARMHLFLTYEGLRYWLSDAEINEENFLEAKRAEPERIVKLKRYLGVIRIPIKNAVVRAITVDYLQDEEVYRGQKHNIK